MPDLNGLLDMDFVTIRSMMIITMDTVKIFIITVIQSQWRQLLDLEPALVEQDWTSGR